MKKRNWVMEVILCAIVCFVVFGVYMMQAKDNGTFQLEDLEGDRAYLADFPLEGHGGDKESSFRFSILDGNLETAFYSCGVAELEAKMKGEKYGLSSLEANFVSTPPEERYYDQTVIVAAEGAKVEEKDTSCMYLFDGRNGIEGMTGQTITMDAAEVFYEIDRWKDYIKKGSGWGWQGERTVARYSTGLILRDKEYFYTADEEHFFMDNYNYAVDGQGGRRLKTYLAEIGDDVYAVTAPDERCEGQTYVFRLALDDYDSVNGEMFVNMYEEKTLAEAAQDRTVLGEAIPLIPIPDPAESKVVGLDAIAEKDLLLLYRTEGNTFIADVYDTTGKLLGSGSTQLLDESEHYKNDTTYIYIDFRIADEIESNIVSWEEGTSVEIDVRGFLEAEENDQHYGGASMITGNVLLWIDNGGNVEVVSFNGKGNQAIVRGDKVLYFSSRTAEEGKQIEEVLGYGTPETEYLEVYEKNSGELLYRGRIKTDFWQDDLKFLAGIDNAPKAGYIRKEEVVASGDYNLNRYIQCYIAGRWEEEGRW